jgi:DNA-binding response OmpR family regulator
MAKATVLIIDDDAELLDELSEFLGYSGYGVATCSIATEAVGTARTSGPDIIIIDLLMPGKNGLQVVEELKTDPRTVNIPILILSGCCDEEIGRKLARVNRFAGFLKKPTRPVEIVEAIERALG